MTPIIPYALIWLLVGGIAGAGIYYYIGKTAASWQTEIISQITLSSTQATITKVDRIYLGDYLWNNTTPSSSIVGTIGMWNIMVTAQAAQLEVTNDRLITMDIADISAGYYRVNMFFLSAPSGWTLHYGTTVVKAESASSFNIQLVINADFTLKTHYAY